jgi:hypothetical protein
MLVLGEVAGGVTGLPATTLSALSASTIMRQRGQVKAFASGPTGVPVAAGVRLQERQTSMVSFLEVGVHGKA